MSDDTPTREIVRAHSGSYSVLCNDASVSRAAWIVLAFFVFVAAVGVRTLLLIFS